jgi:hypothetical protein
MPRYIGASLSAVQKAIRQGKIRFASLMSSTIDVRGAGTKRLSDWLEGRLVKRWWDAGPGTKIVVGWVHSDSIWYSNNQVAGIPSPTKYRIALAAVTRPRSSTRDIEYVFNNLMEREMYEKDPRVRYISSNSAGAKPVFTGNNGIRYGVSYLFVWPAGIIDDTRVSNVTNKLHNLYAINAYRRGRDYAKYSLDDPDAPEALQWAQTVTARAVRERRKKIEGRALTRAMYRLGLPLNIRKKIYTQHAAS